MLPPFLISPILFDEDDQPKQSGTLIFKRRLFRARKCSPLPVLRRRCCPTKTLRAKTRKFKKKKRKDTHKKERERRRRRIKGSMASESGCLLFFFFFFKYIIAIGLFFFRDERRSACRRRFCYRCHSRCRRRNLARGFQMPI